MQDDNQIITLPDLIIKDLAELGLTQQRDRMIEILASFSTNEKLLQQEAKTFLFNAFQHFKKNTAIVESYGLVVRVLSERSEVFNRVATKSISKKGKCPRFAKSLVRRFIASKNPKNTKGKSATGESGHAEFQVDSSPKGVLDEVLRFKDLGAESALLCDAERALNASLNRVKLEVEEGQPADSRSDVPADLQTLTTELKSSYYLKSSYSPREGQSKLAQLCKWTMHYAQRQTDLSRITLCHWCFIIGTQASKGREARPYFQAAIYLHQLLSVEAQRSARWALYRSVMEYFQTYSIDLGPSRNQAGASDAFYHGFLEKVTGRTTDIVSLGRCIVEVTVANTWIITDLFNRLKTRGDSPRIFPTLVRALESPSVFSAAPLQSLELLERLGKRNFASVIDKLNLSMVDNRKSIARALLQYAIATSIPPGEILSGLASTKRRRELAFSLIIEQVVPQHTNSRLKAALIASALGFAEGTATGEHFLADITPIVEEFERFVTTEDPSLIVPIGVHIRGDLLRRARKGTTNFRRNLKKEVLEFYRSVDGFVTQQELREIRDTELTVRLVSDRIPYSEHNTQVTVEIHNSGGGTALGIELILLPVSGQYEVDKGIYEIDMLDADTLAQKEIQIRPTVGVNESIELSIEVRYSSLEEKNKRAELPDSGCKISFYPEAHFIRLPQPYNTGEPATTWFYGRHELLQDMADNCDHGISMIVYGLKRAGKTSVVRRLLDHTLKERGLDRLYWPIYFDLMKKPQVQKSERDFLYLLAQLLLDAVPSGHRKRLGGLSANALREEFDINHFEAFELLLEEVVSIVGNNRLLIVLDEFSSVAKSDALTQNLFGFLSNIIQEVPQLTFIFTGTYILLEMMRKRAFDLAKICSPRLVGFLDESSARRLVVEPVRQGEDPRRGWLEYDPRVIGRIVALTNSHPYLVQYICMQIVSRMNERKRSHVNLADLESVTEMIVEERYHAVIIDNFWHEFNNLEHKVLALIATESSSQNSWVEIRDVADGFMKREPSVSTEEIARTCSSLVDAEMLQKKPTEEGAELYKFSIPLYRMWVRKNKSLQRIFSEESLSINQAKY